MFLKWENMGQVVPWAEKHLGSSIFLSLVCKVHPTLAPASLLTSPCRCPFLNTHCYSILKTKTVSFLCWNWSISRECDHYIPSSLPLPNSYWFFNTHSESTCQKDFSVPSQTWLGIPPGLPQSTVHTFCTTWCINILDLLMYPVPWRGEFIGKMRPNFLCIL